MPESPWGELSHPFYYSPVFSDSKPILIPAQPFRRGVIVHRQFFPSPGATLYIRQLRKLLAALFEIGAEISKP
jgi:hypothetical protein